jgi:GH24 family phage-related lysozyme (muramidase)
MATNAERAKAAALIATALAIPAEGLRQFAYYDPPGILTTCYGHTGPDVVRGKKYSLPECKALLDTDMLNAVLSVERCAPGLPVPVLAAFSDAAYNLGPKIACDTSHSTAARMLKAGDIAGACNQLPRWNRATVGGVSVELPGLTKRRAAERELCLTGIA